MHSSQNKSKQPQASKMFKAAIAAEKIDDAIEILKDHPFLVGDAMNLAVLKATSYDDWSYIKVIAENFVFSPSHAIPYFNALRLAIHNSKVELVELLLKQGVPTSDPESQFFGLHEAVFCQTEQGKIIQLLLSSGASPDEKNDKNYTPGEWSFALDRQDPNPAARKKWLFVAWLATATNQGDYNKTRYGQELSLAASLGVRWLVNHLLVNNVCSTWQDEDGATCLHAALIGRHQEIIALLLSFNPSLNDIKNSNGLTPREYANLNALNIPRTGEQPLRVIFDRGWEEYRKKVAMQAKKEYKLITAVALLYHFKNMPIDLTAHVTKFLIDAGPVAKQQEVFLKVSNKVRAVYLRRTTTASVRAFLQEHNALTLVPEESKQLAWSLQSILNKSPYMDTVRNINAKVTQFLEESSNPFSRTTLLIKQHGLLKTLPPEEKRMPDNKNQPPKLKR